MDELVRQALAKWPDVPDCIGWLALDARGRWRIGEAKDGPRQPITHAAMNAFINRNYLPVGRHWIFQNGPQRVYVELEYTPFVWRLLPGAGDSYNLATQTGVVATPSGAWLDDAGRFLFQATPAGGFPLAGVVHDHDTALVAALLRDADGQELGDEAITALGANPVDATALAATRLHWLRAPGEAALKLPLQRIASHAVPDRFQFEPHPSLAVRIDLDTRR